MIFVVILQTKQLKNITIRQEYIYIEKNVRAFEKKFKFFNDLVSDGE
jgi:hypothetical protein